MLLPNCYLVALPPCHPHPPEYPSITSINCSCSCINPLSYHFQWYQRTLDFSFCTITAPYCYYSFLSSLTNSHSSPYTILVVQFFAENGAEQLLLLMGMGAGEAPLFPQKCTLLSTHFHCFYYNCHGYSHQPRNPSTLSS